MGLQVKNVLGIGIVISSKSDILENIKKYFRKVKSQKLKVKSREVKPLLIFTPNPEIISYAQKDERFKQIVNSSQINITDGRGVVFALKYLYGLEVERLSGVDLMLDLCQLAEKKRLTIGLIGGREGVAVSVSECLLKTYPSLKIEVLEAPEVEIQNSKFKIQNYNLKLKIIDRIVREKIDILFVALGFPKQEYFIEEVKSQKLKVKSNRPLVMMAVGGAFDYLAGRIPRAPEWVRNIGLEWLYRLIHEPWRLPRQFEGGKFFLRVLTSK